MPPEGTMDNADKRMGTPDIVAMKTSFKIAPGNCESSQQSKLLEMPLDILFEIFQYLRPIDLLHLSWVTKDIRVILMSRTLAWLWKKSRANLVSLPECPKDLSEPRYADWVFNKRCHSCLKSRDSTTTVNYDWERICRSCIESSTIYRVKFPSNSLLPVYDVIPFVKMGEAKTNETMKYFNWEVSERWVKELEVTEDKEQWSKDKIQQQRLIDEHIKGCKAWSKEEDERQEKEHEILVQKRQLLILDHIKAMGWADELSRMSTATFGFRKVGSLFEVEQVCEREITEQALLYLEPLLTKCMSDFQKIRVKQERRCLLERRLPILESIVHDYALTLPISSIAPAVGDVFSHPLVQDLVINTPSGQFASDAQRERLFSMLPSTTSHWRADVKEKLYSLITSGCDESYVFDKDKVLDLATTIFSCCHCPFSLTETIRYPRVMAHSCATMASPYAESSSGDLEVIGIVTKRTTWNRYSRLTFKKINMEVISEAVALCGLDPRTTTSAEMDTLDPIFECLSCNHPSKGGRAMMRWFLIPTHYRDCHRPFHSKTPPLKLHLLDESEAAEARIAMKATIIRNRNMKTYQGYVCTHCKIRGGFKSLQSHLKLEHEIDYPTDLDLVLSIDGDCLHELLRVPVPLEEGLSADANQTSRT